jgi:NAD(P)-dependent dehydrogenase (short-subunit alcohol dehydrogenase family)
LKPYKLYRRIKDRIKLHLELLAHQAPPNPLIRTGTYHESEDGYEETFAVNYLGHYYLTELLMPRLRHAAPSRVVLVSSGSHFGPVTTKDVESPEALRRLAAPDEHAKKRFGARAAIGAYGSSKLVRALLFTLPISSLLYAAVQPYERQPFSVLAIPLRNIISLPSRHMAL